MTVLPILLIPDPVLKAVAEPVETIDEAIRTLLDDMLETMYAAPGIGLAAPQVGVLKRVMVIDVAERAGVDEDGVETAGAAPQPMKFINPEIVAASEETSVYDEGCLSIPDYYEEVERPARVTVRYLDETGAAREIEADGLLATCIQHEIDHLNGTLFIDHLSRLKRERVIKKFTKAKRAA